MAESFGLPQYHVAKRIAPQALVSGTIGTHSIGFHSGGTWEVPVFVAPVAAEIKRAYVTVESGTPVSIGGSTNGYISFELLKKGSAGTSNSSIARIDNNSSNTSGVALTKFLPHDFISGSTGSKLDEANKLIDAGTAVTCKVVSKIVVPTTANQSTTSGEVANIDIYWVPQAGLQRIR